MRKLNEPPRSKLRGISWLVAALQTKQAAGNMTRRDLTILLVLGQCHWLKHDRSPRSLQNSSLRATGHISSAGGGVHAVTEVDKGLPTCNFDEPCACNNIHPLPPPAGDIVGSDPPIRPKNGAFGLYGECETFAKRL